MIVVAVLTMMMAVHSHTAVVTLGLIFHLPAFGAVHLPVFLLVHTLITVPWAIFLCPTAIALTFLIHNLSSLYLYNIATYNFTFFSRKEFSTTKIELKAIAAAAMIGESRIPKNGYSTPAAIGMPKPL